MSDLFHHNMSPIDPYHIQKQVNNADRDHRRAISYNSKTAIETVNPDISNLLIGQRSTEHFKYKPALTKAPENRVAVPAGLSSSTAARTPTLGVTINLDGTMVSSVPSYLPESSIGREKRGRERNQNPVGVKEIMMAADSCLQMPRDGKNGGHNNKLPLKDGIGQIERQQLFEVKKPSRSRVAEPKTDFFPFERHTRQPSRIHQSSQEEVPTNKQLKGGELFLTGDAKSRDKANINAQNFGYRKTDISNFSLRTIAEVMAKDEQTNKKAPLTQSSNERPSLLAAHSPDMPSHHTIVKQTRSPPQNQNIEFAFADTPQLMGSHTPPVIDARYPFKKTDITKPGESGSLCGSKSGKINLTYYPVDENPRRLRRKQAALIPEGQEPNI